MCMSTQPTSEPQWSRRLVLQRLAQCGVILAATALRVPGVRADYTPQSAKRAFERYAPRILGGRELLALLESDLKNGSGDAGGRWDLRNGRSEAARLLRAMRIYAGTFSNNYESPKTRELRALVDELERATEQARATQDTARREQYMQAARRCYERYLEESNLASIVLAAPTSQSAE
ncbi:hypothetical protein F1559_001476 [Cyanidiococcus yangmingshanensis]|uniref:Uncharacterized protein n=1 Tax=Cyanidiococcus yangmingshanensis TaxID=2690220 RepID=A0A7J7IHU6_9RHOD|nr:hypothetical protein F1559_001476 [Cyanidiococcus yangmingshanensis]